MSKEVLKFDPENWDWYAFLDASEEVKEDYHKEAKYLSDEWATCACGQLCNVLPRNASNSPKDFVASRLGLLFYENIESKLWKKAKKTMDKIEERTIFLLQQPNFIDPKNYKYE